MVCRYHPLLVALHWLLAALILAALAVGFLVLAQTPNSDPGKIAVLKLHMAGGMFVLALMAVRLVARTRTARPPAATTGHPILDRLARAMHYGFYVLVLLMAATGLSTAIIAGLNRIVFQGSGEPLPPSFAAYPTFVAHAVLAGILASLIVLHVAAAVYHQFVRKDGLIRRMTFGRRAPTRPASGPGAARA